MPPFFQFTPDFINTQYTVDIMLESLFTREVFGGLANRVIFATNNYCFRIRTDLNKGLLGMPFMNIKCINMERDNSQSWYTYPADKLGIFVEDIEAMVRVVPVKLTYEGNVWLERDDDSKAVFNKLAFFQDNHERYTITNRLYNFDKSKYMDSENIAVVNFTNLSIGGEYNEKEWLEKNNIKNIVTNFSVYTNLLEVTTGEVCIPDEILFQFASQFTDASNLTYTEQYEFVVDHVLNIVTPK